MTAAEVLRLKQSLLWFALVAFVIFVAHRRIEKWEIATSELENRVLLTRVAMRRLNKNAYTLLENQKTLEGELRRAVAFVDGLPPRSNVLDRIDRLNALARSSDLRVVEARVLPDERSPFSLERVAVLTHGSYEALRSFVDRIEASPDLATLIEEMRVREMTTPSGPLLEGRMTFAMRAGWKASARQLSEGRTP